MSRLGAADIDRQVPGLRQADRDAANVLGKIFDDGAGAERSDDDAEPPNEPGPPEASS